MFSRSVDVSAPRPSAAGGISRTDGRLTDSTHVAALDRFLASVERRALRMAEISVRDRQEALDIVQDTMLKFVDKYAGRPGDQWPPLFHRILQNRIVDSQRRAGVLRRRIGWLPTNDNDEDPWQQVMDTDDGDPFGVVAGERAAQLLETAVGELPERQRQAFLLRVWEGLNVADTATAMRCSEGSVKTHLSRAMDRLRERLGDHWHD